MRTGILQDKNILGINLEALIVDASGKILKRELTLLVRRGDLVPSPIRGPSAITA